MLQLSEERSIPMPAAHIRRPLSAVFALAILASLPFMTATKAAAQETRIATIDITGQGSVTATPDEAVVSSGVVTDADTAAAALAANSAAMTEMIAAVKAAGIEARHIQTSGFSVQPRYVRVKPDTEEETLKIAGYRVSNSVTVRITDLDKLGTLLDTMVQDGANQVNGISFLVSEADKLRDEARKAAMTDAIRKATLYADAAGVKLGRILSISEQWNSPRPQVFATARAEKAFDAAPPVEVGEETLDVQVNVSWEIQQ